MKFRTVGLIGTDSSHAISFSELLNDPADPLHVPGYRITTAWPGGSPDFPLSASRVETIMGRLETEHGIRRADSPEEVAASCDALMLLSIDGRARTQLFGRIAPYGKPVFIDKPLAISGRDAAEIEALANAYETPIFSVSALRYAVQGAMKRDTIAIEPTLEPILEATVSGPLQIEPTQSVYYWYGIHLAEMLFAILGPDCLSVRTERRKEFDRIVGTWADGRTGTAICRRPEAGYVYEAEVRIGAEAKTLALDPDFKFHYARLIADAVSFFDTGIAPVPLEETLAIVRFLEAAESSLGADGAPMSPDASASRS
ncbi:gfo/Idh/MocA family oxidoreductase [Cohnella hashimotonis]|uniref:Gfo/Idh/MocA family oxidoreductase n=1 Tax=Cohnella hashimotonis TaxID=2826895 RepID=A0ABT6THI0_9BACL|nr:gfo/Idh/MocA family oxidoreductase [Cohnella hashimotonis]MDI4646175.1 gfo/Idh/MocA family oxidoreductase [Cohnella hashimotonis]